MTLTGALILAFSAGARVDWYVVDPMAETPYMPDSAPKGGVKGGTVRIVAAKGEYTAPLTLFRATADGMENLVVPSVTFTVSEP